MLLNFQEFAMDQVSAPVTETPRRGPNLPSWTLTVLESFDVTPKMRRIVFSVENIDRFEYKPGQDIVFFLNDPAGGHGRRHYTIRAVDRDASTLSVDFVLHGNSVGPNFARSVKPGDQVEVKGPRGRVVFRPDADWHLLTGDETCIPGIFAMIEGLPPDTLVHAFIEIADESDKLPLIAEADVRLHWVLRGSRAAGPNDLVYNAVEQFVFPEGEGFAYTIGETSNVRKLRHRLLDRGFPRGRIVAEGYWRPGRVGGHDHV